jgi:hypothetical protein
MAVDAPRPTHALGMNDVSILLPLPADPGTPVIASIAGDGTGEPMMTTGLFGALALDGGDIAAKQGPAVTYDEMQLVAVRFDLCDRAAIGPCPAGADGRLRIVLQPVYSQTGQTQAEDVSVHVFYAIPAADVAGVIGTLRALAAIQDAPADAPLAVSPAAAAGNPDYLAGLRQLVLRYARQSNFVRTTLIGQVAGAGAFEWKLRGIEKDGAYNPIVIPEVNAISQTALVAGGDVVYNIDPLADSPQGFALAVNGVQFNSATHDQQLNALTTIAQIENPLLHDNIDTQCIACHVAEYVGTYRAHELTATLSSLPGFYATARNTAVQSIVDQDPRVVRAFGWIGAQPVITRRVANATAEVLDEIDARFPP